MKKSIKTILITTLVIIMASTLMACGGGPAIDESLALIGQTKGELVDKFGEFEFSYDYAGGYYYTASDDGLLMGFPAVEMFDRGEYSRTAFVDNIACDDIKCNSIWGTTGELIGIKETTPIEVIERDLGVDFSEIEDSMNSYPDSDLGDAYATYIAKDGKKYNLMLTTSTNGIVEPTDSLLVIGQ